MQSINVTRLRNHLPKYLSYAQKGQEILVTSNGHVIARILPPADIQANAKKQLKQLRKNCKIGDIVSPTNEKWDADK